MTSERSTNLPLYQADHLTGSEPLSSHVAREIARSTNALVNRPQLVARWTYDAHYSADTSGSELEALWRDSPAFRYATFGEAEGDWKPAFMGKSTSKFPNHNAYKVRVRAVLQPGRDYAFQLISRANPVPVESTAYSHTVAGTGVEQIIEFDAPASVNPSDNLSVWIRHKADPVEDEVRGYDVLDSNFGRADEDFAHLADGQIRTFYVAISADGRKYGHYLTVYNSFDSTCTGSVIIPYVGVYGIQTADAGAVYELKVDPDRWSAANFLGRDFRMFKAAWFQPYSATVYSFKSGS